MTVGLSVKNWPDLNPRMGECDGHRSGMVTGLCPASRRRLQIVLTVPEFGVSGYLRYPAMEADTKRLRNQSSW